VIRYVALVAGVVLLTTAGAVARVRPPAGLPPGGRVVYVVTSWEEYTRAMQELARELVMPSPARVVLARVLFATGVACIVGFICWEVVL